MENVTKEIALGMSLDYETKSQLILWLNFVRCDHEGNIEGPNCILSFIEGGNESGNFVGTQEEFVAYLQQVGTISQNSLLGMLERAFRPVSAPV